MLCDATVSADVVQVATPLPFKVSPAKPPLSPLPVSVQVIGLRPSKNTAVPAGGPVTAVCEVTVAVNFTELPTVDGFTEETNAVAVLDLFTCWPPDKVPVVPAKFVSPL